MVVDFPIVSLLHDTDEPVQKMCIGFTVNIAKNKLASAWKRFFEATRSVWKNTKSPWVRFTSITIQGASASGFPSMVWGAGGASDLQSVPGADSGPPPALLPRWAHQWPQPWITSSAATARGLESSSDLSSSFSCETNTHPILSVTTF